MVDWFDLIDRIDLVDLVDLIDLVYLVDLVYLIDSLNLADSIGVVDLSDFTPPALPNSTDPCRSTEFGIFFRRSCAMGERGY